MSSITGIKERGSLGKVLGLYLASVYRSFGFLKGRVPFALFKDGQLVGRYDRLHSNGRLAGDSKQKASYSAVVLPDSVVLCYQLEIKHRLTDDQVDRMVQLENMTKSPFEVQETVYGIDWISYYRSNCQRVNIYLSSKSFVRAELEKFASTYFRNEPAVMFESPEGMLIESDWEGGGELRMAIRRRTIFNFMLLLAILVLNYGLAVTPVLKNWYRLEDAKVQYSKLTKDNLPIEKLREQLLSRQDFISVFDQRSKMYYPPIEVLSTVTRLLPDNSFLYSIETSSEGIRIHGQAPNSAGLMAKLSSEPEIAEVKAIAPATKAPGASGETFQLILGLSSVKTGGK